MVAKQANEEADRLIATTALDLVCTNNFVVLVDVDVELTILAGL